MNPTLRLACADMRCEIVPGLGAAVAGLWLDGLAVLRSGAGAGLASVRDAGSYPLVPFSNRIGQAQLPWRGTRHALLRNFAPEPHAIHGVGWQRPWSVMEAQPHFALLAFSHVADASWPFAFDCSQAFHLHADGLEVSLSVTSQAWQPAPFGLGWHPYFVKRPDSHLAFRAAGRWDMGPDKLPTQRGASPGLDIDCAALDVDHCFDGCEGEVLLRDGQLQTRLSSSLRRLVVFTRPERDFVALEPVSHVNNAVQLAEADARLRLEDLGVAVLEPGETLSASMRISVARS